MKAKILILDLETTPLEAYSWGPKWETSLIEITKQMNILSFSAKWLHGKQVTKGWIDYPASKEKDKNLIHDLYKIVNEADIIVGHNIKQFDEKMMNARFAHYGLMPPAPHKIIDTKIAAKRFLRLPSNKLDDIGAYFNIGRKVEHEGFPLWLKCMSGDKGAWKKMLAYNAQDVRLTEKVYLMLLPWITMHPNVSMFAGKVSCTRCGSMNLQARGFYISGGRKHHRAQCQDCGGWMKAPGAVEKIKSLSSL